MSQQAVPRVRGGIPWWIWAMLIPVLIGIVVAITVKVTPVDLDQQFDDLLKAAKSGDKDVLKQGIPTLESDAAYAQHVALLEGMLARLENRDPRAIELFEKAAENDALRAEALTQEGKSRQRMAEFNAAITAYRDAGTNEARLALSNLYLILAANDLAIKEAESVLEENPDNPEATAIIADAYRRMDNFVAANEFYGKTLSSAGRRAAASPYVIANYYRSLLEVNDLATIEEIMKDMQPPPDNQILIAEIMYVTDHIDQLNDLLDQMAGQAGPGAQEPVETVKIRAALALRDDNLEEASAHIDRLIETSPRDIDALKLIRQYFEKKSMPDEVEICDQNMAQVQAVLDQVSELKQVAAKDYLDTETRMILGDLCAKVSQYDEARTWYACVAIIDRELSAEAGTKIQNMVFNDWFVPLPTEPESGDQEPAGPQDPADQEASPADNPESENDKSTSGEKADAPSTAPQSAADTQKTDDDNDSETDSEI